MRGTVISVEVNTGDEVRAGQQMLAIESMKMEHVVIAPHSSKSAPVNE